MLIPQLYVSRSVARQQQTTHRNSNSITYSPLTRDLYIISNVDRTPSYFCDLHQWYCNSRKPRIAVLQPTYILFDFGLAPMTPSSVSGGEYIVHIHLLGLLAPLHHSQDKDNGDSSHTAPYRDLHPDFVG